MSPQQAQRGQDPPFAWWALPPAELLPGLDATDNGLSSREARARLDRFGSNELRAQRPLSRLGVFAEQIRNPLLLILVFAAAISLITGEWGDAIIVIAIVAASVGLGYAREYSAQAAAWLSKPES